MAKCCGRILKLQVCNSMAGYYIGHICPECGPYDRVSGYFKTKEQAEAILKEKQNSIICYAY